MYKVNFPLFKSRTFLRNSFKIVLFTRHHVGRIPRLNLNKITTLAKRSAKLSEMLVDKDRKKNWHFDIMTTKPKARNVFENVHKPFRRQNVLNSLFIKNITDVLSTGDVSPEVFNFGIQITGVKISPCCKILNVFYEIPESQYENSEKIGMILHSLAPKIRAELISRNVMGRVPNIYFLRDDTNARIAEFEMAFKKMNLSENTEPSVIPDDSFAKDIYSFKSSKSSKKVEVAAKENKGISLDSPHKPADMKCDIFGLDHAAIMEKVIHIKKKGKQLPKESAVISPTNIEGDLFSKIPGVCFQVDSNREKILKTFQKERGSQKKNLDKAAAVTDFDDKHDGTDDYVPDPNVHDDFIEEQ